MGMASRVRRTREEKASWVAKWRASGESGRKFAAQHGLKESSLYVWGREFGEKPEFTEVRIRSSGNEVEAVLEVVLGRGRVVRVRGPVDGAQLRAVVEAVESC